MKKIFFHHCILMMIIIAILSNFLIFLIPNEVQAAYNQVTINENGNNNNGISAFPESYQKMLKKLVEDTGHTNWKFKAFYTDIDWNELTSTANENKCLRNTIYKSNGSWLCPCGQQGDIGYYCAHRRIVNYYLDPRNFLTETTIFQFLDLSNSTVVSVSEIEKAVQGTYLAGKVNGVSYAQMIYDAAAASGENALSIVVKIFQELGKGTALPGMISGNNSSYPNTYNFFNYGASDGVGNTLRGLAYAQKAGWNTPQKALVEGAKLIANSYIKAGQNTKYTFKFDVVNDKETGLYWHQYMTNVQDPTNQAEMLFNEYLNNNWLNRELTFVIPIYKNMPAYVKLPSNLTTNDGTLYFISSNYYNVSLRTGPGTSYGIAESLKRNTPVLMLNYNENGTGWSKVRVNGKDGYVSNSYLTPVNTVEDVYQVPNQPSDTNPPGGNQKPDEQECHNFKIEGSYMITEPETTLKDIKSKHTVISATKDGKAIAEKDPLPTGATINISNKNYSVVKLGDLTGDGLINTADLLMIQKHILNIAPITDATIKKAVDLNFDGKIDTADLLGIQKKLLHIANIKI